MDNLLRTGVLTGPFGTMLLTACSEDGGFADWQPSFSRGFSGASDVGTPPANAGDVGSTSGLGRPLEKEMPTPSSIIAWKISWTEKPAGLQSMGSQESATTEQLTATPLSNHTHTPVSFYIYGSNAFVCLQPIDSDALSLEGWGPVPCGGPHRHLPGGAQAAAGPTLVVLRSTARHSSATALTKL